MRAGIVLVPINWRNTTMETRFVLADSDIRIVLVEEEFAGLVSDAAPDVPQIEIGETLRMAMLSAGAGGTRTNDGDAPALLLYTSGTTGKPKGVVITQSDISAQRQAETASGHFDDWRADETLFSPLPNFHIGGLSWALTALARGLPLVISGDAAPAAMLDSIEAHGITRAFMVPMLVRGLIAEIAARGLARSSLRAIHYGAAAMDPQLLACAITALDCRFLQYYGMTEAGGSVTVLAPECHDATRPHLLRSVGRPLPGFNVEIRDAAGRLLPIDVPGEIWLRGPSVARGYRDRPEADVEAFVDGWYRSGDGGRIDAEGFLYLTDRIRDMIVTGGENVYPAEVEAALREHPAVQDCGVFGLPDPKWGEGVTAAVEVRAGHAIDAADLIAFARQRIAAYKIPRRILFDVVLPRTASGKVQRAALREQFTKDGR